MRLFLAAALCAQLLPAFALEEVQITGPGADLPPAPAVKPEPARQPGPHDAEIQDAIKNLSLLLENSRRVLPDTLDTVAEEAVKFTGAVKKALGPEILAEAAAREKAAEDRRRSAEAKRALSALRSALQVSYGVNNGKYPADLSALVSARLPAIPELNLPDHERTAEVRIINSKKSYQDPGKAVNDDGGWLYFANPDSDNYGLLILNCRHKDPLGTEFYKY